MGHCTATSGVGPQPAPQTGGNRVRELKQLRKSIYESYAQSVGLDPGARYASGAPLRPVVPLDAARGGLLLTGAYPSARFQQIEGVRDVPVGDNLGPFENERWFDGVRVRKQRSAIELEKLFLNPMDVGRAQCWITNLVKVFLFKKGHRKKYEQLRASPPAGYRCECFRELGERSVPFLERELKLASPRLVVTLGREAAGVHHGVRSPPAQSALLVPAVTELRLGGMTLPTVHCAHPGILMRSAPPRSQDTSKNNWQARHETEFIPALRQAWQGVG